MIELTECPKCGADIASEDLDPIEEDCWRYGRNEGHYTRCIGMWALCPECGHEWEVPQEDDGPDPDDRDDFDVDADSRANAYFGQENNRREPQ